MLEYILDGGWIMLPLVVLSILSLAIIIDRWRVFVTATQNTEIVRKQVADCMDRDDLGGAIEVCQQTPSPLSAVALTGLNKYRQMLSKNRSLVEMEGVVSKLMEDYTPRALAVLEKRFNLLVLIASVSPLLGMTGTVTGMIKSFDKMAESAGLDPGAVSGGISEALLTTASGLIVAIPALIAYNIFTRRSEDYILIVEQMISDVVTFISDRSA